MPNLVMYLVRAWSCLCCVLLVSIFFGNIAQAQPVAQVQRTAAGYQELTPFITAWTGATMDSGVQDALRNVQGFTAGQTTGAAMGFGFVRQPVWLRFDVENPSDSLQNRIIEIAYAHILEIDYFEIVSGQVRREDHVGSARPIYERSLQGRHTAFSIVVEPHTRKQVLLRLYTHHPLIVPLRLWEPDAYAAYAQKDWAIQAWYFGIACAMLAFNALLLLALRDRIYLLYTVWIVCITMTIGIGVGVAKLFLWPQSQWWASYANAVFDNWSMAALLQFLRVMLNLQSLQRRVDTVFKLSLIHI